MLLTFKTETPETFSYPTIIKEFKTIYEDPNQAIRIRTMSLPELVEVRNNWLIPEGWPGIKYTLAATYANDPDGFYLLEKDGKKIASISMVTYPEISLAYVGFYAVDKAFRGQGYGKLLITKTIEYAASKRGITAFGLNCMEKAVPMYQKYGFEVTNLDEFWKYTAKATQDYKTNLTKIDDAILGEIIRFDAAVLGAHRKEFLRNFISKPNTMTIISQESGNINGYGVISEREPAVPEANMSYKIGPLYADNDLIAKSLLQQLITITKAGESVYLETPGNNPIAAATAKAIGFEKIGTQAKMFKGIAPWLDTKQIFCYGSVTIGG